MIQNDVLQRRALPLGVRELSMSNVLAGTECGQSVPSDNLCNHRCFDPFKLWKLYVKQQASDTVESREARFAHDTFLKVYNSSTLSADNFVSEIWWFTTEAEADDSDILKDVHAKVISGSRYV